jgi:hypothetical protein
MASGVTVRDVNGVFKKLDRFGRPGVFRRPMVKSVAHLHNKIAVYAPASEANSSGSGYSWYERGFGTRTVTGRAYPTSETLGRRWTHEVSADGKRGVVGNNASYGPFVQSGERQAGFHKRRGWETDQGVAEKEGKTVVGFFEDEIRELTE